MLDWGMERRLQVFVAVLQKILRCMANGCAIAEFEVR